MFGPSPANGQSSDRRCVGQGISFELAQLDELRRRAREKGCSLSSVVRAAIDLYFDSPVPEPRDEGEAVPA